MPDISIRTLFGALISLVLPAPEKFPPAEGKELDSSGDQWPGGGTVMVVCVGVGEPALSAS
jgi:hypothetical protein